MAEQLAIADERTGVTKGKLATATAERERMRCKLDADAGMMETMKGELATATD